ncbi:MAG: lysophospholipase [Cyclobacteriaceae bacterium]|nr:lysophospholipase [Cyclobacteriaceae bacterium]
MQVNEFYIQSGTGKELYGRSWTPDENPRAAIAILHGLGDHIGRYENFAGFFTGNQMAVIGIDLPGHGRSGGKRGHMGDFPLILTDVLQLMLEARRRFSDIPIFLFGHNLGGNIAISYAIRQSSKEIMGVILSAPLIQPTGMHISQKMLSYLPVGRFFPSFTMSFTLDPMELSHDPSTGIHYLNDPDKHDRISVRLYHQLTKSSQWIMENAGRMSYALLVMHGRDDRIMPWETSGKLVEKIPGNAELKIWEEMRHELHHEKSKILVLNYMLTWMQSFLEERKTG